ncbi:putative peptidase S10, serine carboxypeptidase, alpha/Beta hydrolase [Helianthus annuus]|nr:putative peptidase S10, serine carboxypeptidase, alpha/Beta hydrolase [Helianthus annuus]KAJ0786777.1 putative peptidase S10, serine carboxypeptidase, alpha/Beta hydrolase [Helianthus annuus]
MKSTYIRVSLLIIIVHLTALSKSKSIIRDLPGFHGDLPFTFETGYVEVGDDKEIQFFYYFVESQRDPSHDPLLLYLTGGPGTPALYPFMYQIGKFISHKCFIIHAKIFEYVYRNLSYTYQIYPSRKLSLF